MSDFPKLMWINGICFGGVIVSAAVLVGYVTVTPTLHIALTLLYVATALLVIPRIGK